MTVWTEERSALLRTLWDDGMSAATIGRRFGASKNAVVGRVHRMELTARPSPIPGRDLTAPKVPRAPKSISAPRANATTLPPLAGALTFSAAVISPPSVALPFPRVPDAPRPISSGSCQWPMWSHTERPKFHANGLPLLCGATRSHGSYCGAHGRLAYVRKAEAA